MQSASLTVVHERVRGFEERISVFFSGSVLVTHNLRQYLPPKRVTIQALSHDRMTESQTWGIRTTSVFARRLASLSHISSRTVLVCLPCPRRVTIAWSPVYETIQIAVKWTGQSFMPQIQRRRTPPSTACPLVPLTEGTASACSWDNGVIN